MDPASEDALAQALEAAAPLARLFAAAGHRLYLVGGVVRSIARGEARVGADIDCTTDARPAQIRRIVSPEASSLWRQGERFGTIGCVIGGQAFEITTHRGERYRQDSRKPEVRFEHDLLADLQRRDFTINAMALDAVAGTLFDPHRGQDDLRAAILRTPLDPETSFADDPLRMLRAARFVASLHLTPSDDLVAVVRSLGERMSIVSVERVRDELERLLLLPDPAAGLRFLFATGLAAHALGRLRVNDSERLARTVTAVAALPAQRWASLLTQQPADEVTPVLESMRCSRALIDEAAGLLAARRRLLASPDSEPAVRRAVHECEANVDAALDFARKVAAASGEPAAGLDRFGATLAALRRAEDVDNLKLPLDGAAIMAQLGLEPGPRVGQALAHLRELTFERGALTTLDAITEMRRWAASH